MSFTVQSIENRAKKSIIIFLNEHILDLRDLNFCVEIGLKRETETDLILCVATATKKGRKNCSYLICTKFNSGTIKIMLLGFFYIICQNRRVILEARPNEVVTNHKPSLLKF